MRVEDVVAKIEEEQRKLARSSLLTPADRSSFEYGRVSGLYAGLERAKQLVSAIYEDKEARDNAL